MNRLLCVAAAFLFLNVPASAQSCTFSMPNINFGNIDLTAGINYTSSVNLTSTCTGTPGQTIRICPNINAGTGGVNGSGSVRYMLNGASQLQYNLYRNTTYSSVWGSYIWGLPPQPSTVSLVLNSSGTGTIARAIRTRVPLGQGALPTGRYTSSFSGANTRLNYAYSSVGNCATITSLNLNPTQIPFTVSANAGTGCAVTATDLNFGTQTLLNANIDQTNQVSVRCATGVAYAVGFDGGLLLATNPTQRKLDNGFDQITYGLYRDAARSQPWGDIVGTNTVAGTGNGAFQNFTAYGRIPPQPTPPADIYDDTIVITVTY
jgi:spore coat protein U-like protein